MDIYYYLEDNGQSSTVWEPNKTLHRLDGPALEYYNGIFQFDWFQGIIPIMKEWLNGSPFLFDKYWLQNGKLHREDGPAIDHANGRKEWYYKGKWLEHIKSQEQYEKWLKLKVFW